MQSYIIPMESYENLKDHELTIEWGDDQPSVGVYDFAWLRDNCRCPKCVDPSSGQKLFNRQHVMKSFPTLV